jgi:hypothetical protein
MPRGHAASFLPDGDEDGEVPHDAAPLPAVFVGGLGGGRAARGSGANGKPMTLKNDRLILNLL